MTSLRIAGGRVVAVGTTVWNGTEVRGRPRAVLRNGEVVA